MSVRKSERLLNLLIMLLVQRHYVPKERIREILYAEASDDAFEKMFERDKDELRALGVPIEVGSLDAFFEEPGYRVRPDDFALPEIDLAADEAAVVGLATRVWQHARLADATSDALKKLTAAGVTVDESALDIVEPQLTAEEPSFDVFWEAAQERIPVTFDYQRGGSAEVATRRLEPWGVVRYSGRWYVVGRDVDRDDDRVFRLSRVRGTARKSGPPGSYTIPENADLREVTRRLAPAPRNQETATLLARAGTCYGLRRRATSGERVDGPDDASAWDRLSVPFAGTDILADELMGYAANVYVEAPDELRKVIVDRLTHAAGAR
ncbi:helix-turn-helix transcriptional regulator [Nocardioides speluncae]|uniref:helix-turn-helix transcriptional regulator n=1 Tax=Nocardioides speluncae TaxID=2670337 RepID=UPI000D6865F1|nr:WYL domain-containing protein [Nocardioides speluncae]